MVIRPPLYAPSNPGTAQYTAHTAGRGGLIYSAARAAPSAHFAQKWIPSARYAFPNSDFLRPHVRVDTSGVSKGFSVTARGRLKKPARMPVAYPYRIDAIFTASIRRFSDSLFRFPVNTCHSSRAPALYRGRLGARRLINGIAAPAKYGPLRISVGSGVFRKWPTRYRYPL